MGDLAEVVRHLMPVIGLKRDEVADGLSRFEN